MSDASESTFLEKVLEKFSKSREFTISTILHIFLIGVFSTAVLFEAVQEPPDFEGGGNGFVQPGEAVAAPPQQQQMQQEQVHDVTVTPPSHTQQDSQIRAITTTGQGALDFEMTTMIMPTPTMATEAQPSTIAPPPPTHGMGEQMTPEIAAGIAGFAESWQRGRGPGTGAGVGIRQREFEFHAFIGRYAGGNWNSTVPQLRGTESVATKGSLPNLLYIMSQWSDDRITTNYKNVRVIDLDSDELFSIKPPFIFLTGTRDFRLTEKEVETLRRYVRLGGCIWGDSSVPGRNSRFDIAFRREMRRVIPDVDKDFEPLPNDHPIFRDNYYPEITGPPPGLNFYQEPVYAMEIYGEIAILYTANDYGNMMQIGVEKDGRVDLRRDEHHRYVAINEMIWDNRHVYLGNITPRTTGTARGRRGPLATGDVQVAENLVDVYKFCTNVVVHLLTRWDRVIATAPRL